MRFMFLPPTQYSDKNINRKGQPMNTGGLVFLIPVKLYVNNMLVFAFMQNNIRL